MEEVSYVAERWEHHLKSCLQTIGYIVTKITLKQLKAILTYVYPITIFCLVLKFWEESHIYKLPSKPIFSNPENMVPKDINISVHLTSFVT